MSAGAAGGGAAAAAAAAKRQREQEEEEELTSYQEHELNDDWEFKILRSMTGAFKHPDKLRQVLDEEAQAGWVLVEKFDNSRLRLKRPASARTRDNALSFDPYRAYFGYTEAQYVFIVLGCVFGILAAIGLAAAAIALAI
jgi:hypothetical protein